MLDKWLAQRLHEDDADAAAAHSLLGLLPHSFAAHDLDASAIAHLGISSGLMESLSSQMLPCDNVRVSNEQLRKPLCEIEKGVPLCPFSPTVRLCGQISCSIICKSRWHDPASQARLLPSTAGQRESDEYPCAIAAIMQGLLQDMSQMHERQGLDFFPCAG